MKERITSMRDENDDWYSQEKKREARQSVWQFDGSASVIRHEHEENCEKEQVRQEHEIRHQAREVFQQQIKENINVNPKKSTANVAKGSLIGLIIFIYIVMMILNLFF